MIAKPKLAIISTLRAPMGFRQSDSAPIFIQAMMDRRKLDPGDDGSPQLAAGKHGPQRFYIKGTDLFGHTRYGMC
jgi:hypothetical protein